VATSPFGHSRRRSAFADIRAPSGIVAADDGWCRNGAGNHAGDPRDRQWPGTLPGRQGHRAGTKTSSMVPLMRYSPRMA